LIRSRVGVQCEAVDDGRRCISLLIFVSISSLLLTIWVTAQQTYALYFDHKYELRGNDQLLSSSPQIAATEKGDVYVAWIDKNSTSGDSDIVFSRSNDSGKSFGRLFELRGNDQLLSSSPQIAATEKGDVYVAWIDKNSTSGDSNIIFRASTDKGLKFAPIIKANKDTRVQLLFSPKIAATGGGNAYVAWSEDSIQFKEFIDNGNVFGETILLSNRPSLAPLEIAATETGNIYVVWIDSKKSASGGTLLHFKRISEIFERNS
jgi:hypothetical protein